MPQSFVFMACANESCELAGVARMIYLEEGGGPNPAQLGSDVCRGCGEKLELVPNDEVNFE